MLKKSVSADIFFQKLGRDPSDEDCFFDLLSKFQSSRMDDQRCHLDDPQNGDNGEGAANSMPSLNEMIGQLRKSVHVQNDIFLHKCSLLNKKLNKSFLELY